MCFFTLKISFSFFFLQAGYPALAFMFMLLPSFFFINFKSGLSFILARGIGAGVDISLAQREYLQATLDGLHPEFLENCLEMAIELAKTPAFVRAAGGVDYSPQANVMYLMRLGVDGGIMPAWALNESRVLNGNYIMNELANVVDMHLFAYMESPRPPG